MAYRLQHIKGNTYYLEGTVNLGAIRNEGNPAKSIVVDTGIDDDAGRRLLKLMQEEGMEPGYIINTHSHADHCGGNSIVRSRTSAVVYAPPFDKGIIEYPELEPFYLYSASPLAELDTKFLKAKPSEVGYVLQEGRLTLEGVQLDILALHGHTPAMIGVATEDNVLFAGDAFFSVEILEKHGLPYFTDIGKTLGTLEYLKTLNYEYYLPCHGGLLQDPIPTLEANIRHIKGTIEYIAELCKKPLDREEIAASMVERYGIKLTIPQYYLTISTVSAFLSYMTKEKILRTLFENNKLKFESI